MTESEVVESKELQRCIMELDHKLVYWKHQHETAARLVEKLTERMELALERQKELLQSRAAGA